MSKTRLIFIPGWAGDSDNWTELSSELSHYPFRAYIPWQSCISREKGETHLWSLLQNPRYENVLIGWSLGAIISLAASLETSASLKGMILISATDRFLDNQDHPGIDERVLKAMKLKLRRNPEVVITEFFRLCFAPEKRDGRLSRIVSRAMDMEQADLADGLDYLGSVDLSGKLSDIQVPTLLIHGSEDQVIPVESARILHSKLPDSIINVLRGAGHALPFTSSHIMSKAIKDFLNGLQD